MLSQFFPPFLGGEEQHVSSLARELAARGHRVAVCTLWSKGLPEFEVDQGVRVYRLHSTTQRADWLYSDPAHPHAPPLPDPELSWALRTVIKAERPEIVHAHNWIVHSFLPLKTWSGAKLVLSLHDASLACATKKLLYHDESQCSGPAFLKCLGCAAAHYGMLTGIGTTLANWGMTSIERNLVDLFLPVSRSTAAANHLIGSGLRLKVLPNFVREDTAYVDHSVDGYLAQLPANEYILFVGALGEYKGVDILLRAYKKLWKPPPLVLIGYTIKESPIRTTEFPTNVTILKQWPHDAIMEAWRRSLLGVIPSLVAEAFGIVALEAMIAAKPVVASRVGGLPDIVVEGETGLLVPPGDVDALATALDGLLADSTLLRRMGKAGHERVGMFTARKVIPQFEQAYQELLN